MAAIEENEKESEKKSSGSFWDTMGDLFKMSVEDRIKHPVIGAIFLTFILWNWQEIALILFPTTEMGASSLIGDRIAKTSFLHWGSLGLPILFGLLYAMGIPYLTWGYQRIISYARLGVRRIKDKERDYKTFEEYLKIINDKDKQISKLTSAKSNIEYHLTKERHKLSNANDQIKSISSTIQKIKSIIDSEPKNKTLSKIIRYDELEWEKKSIEQNIKNYELENSEDARYQYEMENNNPDDDYDEHAEYADAIKRVEEINAEQASLKDGELETEK